MLLEVARKLRGDGATNWKKVFEGADAKNKKSELNLKEVKLRLKGMKAGVSAESLDQLLSYFTFGRSGEISPLAFEDQLESFIKREEDRQEAQIGRLKEMARAVKRGIDEEGMPFEKIFAECD